MNRTGYKGTAEERGYGKQWKRLRKQVMARDGGWCQACRAEGKLVKGNQADHIIPKAKGGTDAIENIQILCEEHHRIKSLDDRGYEDKPKGCDVNGMPIGKGHPWSRGGYG